ncbi:MAG: hypothetical protein ROW52_04985 [Anaerolineaceae bacterium]|jgi:hypothetical protein
MNEDQATLFSQQIQHALDLMRADIDALKAIQNHDRSLSAHRLAALEERANDHELRIRAATDGVTQFKMWAGFASGSSGIVSLIALLKAFLGG